MGYMTVEEMSQEIAANVGGSVNDPVRFLRWVNWAVQNLASYVVLDELMTTGACAVAEGATKITTTPADLLGIHTITLWDAAASTIVYKRLNKMKREFYPQTQAGRPTHYKRQGGNIVTWPEADTDYTGEIEYFQVPAKITTVTGVTGLPAMWDVAIVQLATHYGLESLRQHDEADRWLARFLGYVASRKTDKDISADVPGGGVQIVWDYDDLTEDPPMVTE